MLKRYIKHVKWCWKNASNYVHFNRGYYASAWRTFFQIFSRHANPVRFYRYETDPLIVAARQRAKRPTTPCRSLDTSPSAVARWKKNKCWKRGIADITLPYAD